MNYYESIVIPKRKVLNNLIKEQKLYSQALARSGSWRPLRTKSPSVATAAGH